MNSILPSSSTFVSGARPIRSRISVVMVVYQTGEALVEQPAAGAGRAAGRRVRHRRQRLPPADEAERTDAVGAAEPRVVLRQRPRQCRLRARGQHWRPQAAAGANSCVFLNPDAFLQDGLRQPPWAEAALDSQIPTVVGRAGDEHRRHRTARRPVAAR